MVFVGHGINSEEHGYNDFEQVDIHDKVVMDPKSGMRSIEDVNPAIEKYLSKPKGFKAGFNVAQYSGPIKVDKPMSKW